MKLFGRSKPIKILIQPLHILKSIGGENKANEFLIDLLERVFLISKYPKAFRKSEKISHARRSVLSKQTIIYYQVDTRNKAIEIISVFDSRQDPDILSP